MKSTEQQMKDYLAVTKHFGRVGSKDDKKVFTKALSVKELKKILENIEDENLPVVLEIFTDACTSQEMPLYAVDITGCSTEDNKKSYDIVTLKTVESDSYEDWIKEGHGN